MKKETSVFGWECPWSGDEAEPIPYTYWIWCKSYRTIRKLKHFVGWHDWREYSLGSFLGSSLHCDWCGKNRIK